MYQAVSVLVILLSSILVVYPLPVFNVSGTHAEVGFAIGQQFASNIKDFVDNYAYLQESLIPFYQTASGKQVVDAFTEVNAKYYPGYFEELRGIATGSSIPFIDLLLLTFRAELEFWINPLQFRKPSELNCADIHVNVPGNVLVGHNEDAALIVHKNAYLLSVEIPESGESFTAYTYPGILPGLAFGWTADLTFSFNFLFPIPVKVGLARSFINRHVLGASSVADAIARATPENRAFGFTLNLGDIKNHKSYSIEVSPEIYAVLEVRQNFSHFNDYKILNVPQEADMSTTFRQARADELSAPSNAEDIRNILGDTNITSWPIFRNAAPPDHAATVATVLFDLVGQKVSVWESNPKNNPPEMVFGIVRNEKN